MNDESYCHCEEQSDEAIRNSLTLFWNGLSQGLAHLKIERVGNGPSPFQAYNQYEIHLTCNLERFGTVRYEEMKWISKFIFMGVIL